MAEKYNIVRKNAVQLHQNKTKQRHLKFKQ
jgi:hypothetical protein